MSRSPHLNDIASRPGASGAYSRKERCSFMFSSVSHRIRRTVYFGCLAIVAFLQLPPAYSNENPALFRWLDKTKDAQPWARIEAAFANELKPDTTGGEDSPSRFTKKFIARIGLYGTSTLVLVGQREDPSPDQPALFQAYNYDLVANQKKKISGRSPDDLWQLRFLKEAKFEESPVPDMVFSFKDCSDCESVTLLGSFQLRSALTVSLISMEMASPTSLTGAGYPMCGWNYRKRRYRQRIERFSSPGRMA